MSNTDMEIKTYRAASVQEALQLVRRDLGPQALVLRTREVRTGGLIGLLNGRKCTEVIASLEPPQRARWQLSRKALDRGIDLSEMDSIDY